jgi:hypothetical protein
MKINENMKASDLSASGGLVKDSDINPSLSVFIRFKRSLAGKPEGQDAGTMGQLTTLIVNRT